MDYLNKYKMNDEDKERVLMVTLRRIGHSHLLPKFYVRKKNLDAWRWIDDTFGEGCSSDAVAALDNLGLIKGNPGKTYELSEKGRLYLRRGYVIHEKKNYARRVNIISIASASIALLTLLWYIIEHTLLR